MKIKKTSTAQIPKTEGAVIDSFDSGSDETTNAPSIRAIKEMIGGTILYENVDGTREDVPLSQSSENFKRLKIIAIELNNNRQVVSEVDLDISNRFALNLNVVASNVIYWSFTHYTVLETSMTVTSAGYTERILSTGAMNASLGYNQFKVVKVIGFKY